MEVKAYAQFLDGPAAGKLEEVHELPAYFQTVVVAHGKENTAYKYVLLRSKYDAINNTLVGIYSSHEHYNDVMLVNNAEVVSNEMLFLNRNLFIAVINDLMHDTAKKAENDGLTIFPDTLLIRAQYLATYNQTKFELTVEGKRP